MAEPPTGVSSHMNLYELETVPLLDQMVPGQIYRTLLPDKNNKIAAKANIFPHRISHLKWWMVSFWLSETNVDFLTGGGRIPPWQYSLPGLGLMMISVLAETAPYGVRSATEKLTKLVSASLWLSGYSSREPRDHCWTNGSTAISYTEGSSALNCNPHGRICKFKALFFSPSFHSLIFWGDEG